MPRIFHACAGLCNFLGYGRRKLKLTQVESLHMPGAHAAGSGFYRVGMFFRELMNLLEFCTIADFSVGESPCLGSLNAFQKKSRRIRLVQFGILKGARDILAALKPHLYELENEVVVLQEC